VKERYGMATYAVGDIQGCLQELIALVELIKFDRQRDRLWFTGDLVNRGPDSLQTLRYVRDLGDAAVVVLGNHDLHLLAMTADPDAKPRPRDTIGEILLAPDLDELVDFLRELPLLFSADGFTMVHAGLPPQWDLATAHACAREVENILRGDQWVTFTQNMYGDQPDRWRADLDGWERTRFITNALTRIRYCDEQGRLNLDEKGSPNDSTGTLQPWYQRSDRLTGGEKIIFGHWSTLTLSAEEQTRYQVFPVDTGCVWGGRLSAMRLEDGKLFSVAALG
jgi:bis(5'-nucleosyl)-tetraphosphatase (symmetrical)